jgi:flagellar L-ring protein precursor FlgH
VKTNLYKLLLVLLLVASLPACVSTKKKKQEVFKPSLPQPAAAKPAANGSIYQANTAVNLFSDRAAKRVGDIIIVVLNETTSASKKASTKTSKENDVNTSVTSAFGRGVTKKGVPLLNNELSSAKEFSGSGDSSQSNQISGTIAVTVEKVLPNGNLMIRGQKRLRLNRGDEYVRIAGIIRPSDISADNTVTSTRVADARIIYSGKGVVADSNAMGWLAKFFNSKMWPF